MTSRTLIISLLPAIYRFNFQLCDYVDPSWLSFVTADVAGAAVTASKLGRQLVSVELCRQHELTPIQEMRFENARLRAALLSSSELKRLVLYMGAGLCSSKLALIIKGQDVRILRERLGRALFEFGQKRARFLFQPSECLLDQLPTWPQDPDEACAVIQRIGKKCLVWALADPSISDEQIWRRVRMKFPASWNWDGGSEVAQNLRDQAAAFLEKILQRELRFQLV
jgi:hypothetical protein